MTLEQAARLLADGQLVAFPTETVYGLGADAGNPVAVAAIFQAKGRPSDHPVIVHLAQASDAAAWTGALSVPTQAVMEKLISRFWPGPLTLILPRAAGVPDAVTGGQNSVGLRCPSHPVAQALLMRFAELKRQQGQALKGIAAPSANRFGHVSPTTAQHVRDEFGDAIAVLDGGACPVGIESTIVDLTRFENLGPVLLRPGSITAAMLTEVIGTMPVQPDHAAPRASGTLVAHYAPRTPLQLVTAAELEQMHDPSVAVWTHSLRPRNAHWLQAPTKVEQYAHDLYAVMRRLDNLNMRRILVERPPETSEWAAIQDRLGRAASGN